MTTHVPILEKKKSLHPWKTFCKYLILYTMAHLFFLAYVQVACKSAAVMETTPVSAVEIVKLSPETYRISILQTSLLLHRVL